jgi:hypothetical protein
MARRVFSRDVRIFAEKVDLVSRDLLGRNYFRGLCECFGGAGETFDAIGDVFIFGDVIDLHMLRNRKYSPDDLL